MTIYQTYADELSIYPGVQQVVGVATVIQNIYQFSFDLVELINDVRIRVLGKRTDTDYTSKERADMTINSLLRRSENPDDLSEGEKFMVRDQIEPNLLRRITYIGIGCIRTLPLIGTAYSLIAVCYFPKPSRNLMQNV